jgi:hypothetical protein
MGKSGADDDHDAHDDELQSFSKGGAALLSEMMSDGWEPGEDNSDNKRCGCNAVTLTRYLSKKSRLVVNPWGILCSSS